MSFNQVQKWIQEGQGFLSQKERTWISYIPTTPEESALYEQ